MTATVPTATPTTVGLLAGFVAHDEQLGGQRPYRLQRQAAARAFLARHRDLDDWMARPVEVRLVELRRHELAWPFVAYAIVTGAARADTEFLFAKNFGHSMFRWINVVFGEDVARLEGAAGRLGAASPRVAVRCAVQLAVAFAGRAPSTLTIEDLDQLAAAIDTSPRLSEPMRRGRRADLFRLRRFLFEAGMVTLPAQHRREGGPATRQARVAVVRAPEFRRTLTAYLDARATVLRPKTIDKLTSALAIFGEFVCDHDPNLESVAGLERRHIEAFLAWTATPGKSGQPRPHQDRGPVRSRACRHRGPRVPR